VGGGGQAVISKCLRAIAVAFVVLALVDPAVSVTRDRPLAVRVHLRDSDPDAVSVRARLRDVLRDRIEMVEGSHADAVVVIGTSMPEEIVSGSAPVSTVALGAAPNVAVIDAPDSIDAAPGQIVSIPIVLEGWGVSGKTSALLLRHRTVEVARAEHEWKRDGRATVVLRYVATAGANVVNIRVDPVEGENRIEDNRADVAIAVAERPFDVAVLEPRPSWPAGFVRRVLEGDPAFRVSSLLLVSRGIAARAGDPPRQITAADLSRFDVVLAGAPEELRAPEVQALREFAEVRGGSVMLLPDRRPSGAYLNLLPERRGQPAPSEQLLREPRLLAPAGLLASEIVPIPGVQAVADTLAETDDRVPVVISWPVGDGRIVFSGALDAWRFRGDSKSAFSEFWRKTVSDAAAAAPARLRLEVKPSAVRPFERAHLTVRVRRTELTSSSAPQSVGVPGIGADLIAANGSTEMIRLWPAAEAGSFEADIRAPAGRYDVRVTTGGGAVADTSLTVDGEAAVLSGRRSDLLGMPELTGGVAVDATHLQPLIQHLAGLPRSTDKTVIHPLRSPWWMLFLVVVLSGEWILRRRAGLR
jgi:hypothetical protein